MGAPRAANGMGDSCGTLSPILKRVVATLDVESSSSSLLSEAGVPLAPLEKQKSRASDFFRMTKGGVVALDMSLEPQGLSSVNQWDGGGKGVTAAKKVWTLCQVPRGPGCGGLDAPSTMTLACQGDFRRAGCVRASRSDVVPKNSVSPRHHTVYLDQSA